MTRTLVLPVETKIRTIAESGQTKLASIADTGKHFQVYDSWGYAHTVDVIEEVETEVYALKATSGEMIICGKDSELLLRMGGKFRRELVTPDKASTAPMVRMPQKKIGPVGADITDAFDGDKSGIFLMPEAVSSMITMQETVASHGVAVRRADRELKIYLERGRPSCFATKLIMGSFVENLEKTIDSLASTSILCLSAKMDSNYLETVATTGIIFEGDSAFNDMFLMPPVKAKKPRKMARLELPSDVLLETTWMQI